MVKKVFKHVSIPILVGCFAFMVYYTAHVNSRSIVLPPGVERKLFEPLNSNYMTGYWQDKSITIGLTWFGIAAILSILLLVVTYIVSKRRRESAVNSSNLCSK